jgi:cyclohexanone monooxygenase|tara:strand:+ start:1141 stop:1725 length:585 start_codon:yes stop_codon:yes gene_type:complete
VDTHGKGVERLTEKGVVVDGKEYEVDCLIFATGFESATSYTRRSGYDIIGKQDRTLSSYWENGMRTLHGLYSHGFPNCFFIGITQGANTVNLPYALDEQANHLAYILDEARSRGASTIEVSAEAEQQYLDEIGRMAKVGQRFYSECTPGYYNGEGTSGNSGGFFSNMYGGGSIRFFRLLENWRSDGGLDGLELR